MSPAQERKVSQLALALIEHAQGFARQVDALRFAPPVDCVYNPLDYAFEPHQRYLRRMAWPKPRALLLGMNPGPFGMVQTGVPFGEVSIARDWLELEAPVRRPKVEHPKRPILGFQCPRNEVSGARLWGWARERFGTPERFAASFFVWNYCPLAFLEAGGRNLTPDKLPAAEQRALFALCDRALAHIVQLIEPEQVIGVGVFARDRARAALPDFGGPIATVLHPSPASPAANRGWARQAEAQFSALGLHFEA